MLINYGISESMIMDQTSKASKESYSAISEQGKDGLCSTIGMQCKKSQV